VATPPCCAMDQATFSLQPVREIFTARANGVPIALLVARRQSARTGVAFVEETILPALVAIEWPKARRFSTCVAYVVELALRVWTRAAWPTAIQNHALGAMAFQTVEPSKMCVANVAVMDFRQARVAATARRWTSAVRAAGRGSPQANAIAKAISLTAVIYVEALRWKTPVVCAMARVSHPESATAMGRLVTAAASAVGPQTGMSAEPVLAVALREINVTAPVISTTVQALVAALLSLMSAANVEVADFHRESAIALAILKIATIFVGVQTTVINAGSVVVMISYPAPVIAMATSMMSVASVVARESTDCSAIVTATSRTSVGSAVAPEGKAHVIAMVVNWIVLGSVAGMQFKTSAGCVAVLVLWWVAATAGPVVQWIARGYAAVVMRKTFATSVVAMEAAVSTGGPA
jgi:hypothetical protein